jgi:hypothetical protein
MKTVDHPQSWLDPIKGSCDAFLEYPLKHFGRWLELGFSLFGHAVLLPETVVVVAIFIGIVDDCPNPNNRRQLEIALHRVIPFSTEVPFAESAYRVLRSGFLLTESEKIVAVDIATFEAVEGLLNQLPLKFSGKIAYAPHPPII